MPVKGTQRITRNVFVGGMGHGDEVLQYKRTITYVIIDSYTVTRGLHIGPLESRVPLGLRFPSGNVRGVMIPPNINLSKGLRFPWTVSRICMKKGLRSP